jgi:hypothetical protein
MMTTVITNNSKTNETNSIWGTNLVGAINIVTTANTSLYRSNTIKSNENSNRKNMNIFLQKASKQAFNIIKSKIKSS